MIRYLFRIKLTGLSYTNLAKWGCGDHIRIGVITRGKWASHTDIGCHLRKEVVCELTKKVFVGLHKKSAHVFVQESTHGFAQKSARGFIQKSVRVLAKRFVGKWLLGFRYIVPD